MTGWERGFHPVIFFLQHPDQMYSAITNTLPLNALSLDLFVVIAGGVGGS